MQYIFKRQQAIPHVLYRATHGTRPDQIGWSLDLSRFRTQDPRVHSNLLVPWTTKPPRLIYQTWFWDHGNVRIRYYLGELIFMHLLKSVNPKILHHLLTLSNHDKPSKTIASHQYSLPVGRTTLRTKPICWIREVWFLRIPYLVGGKPVSGSGLGLVGQVAVDRVYKLPSL